MRFAILSATVLLIAGHAHAGGTPAIDAQALAEQVSYCQNGSDTVKASPECKHTFDVVKQLAEKQTDASNQPSQ